MDESLLLDRNESLYKKFDAKIDDNEYEFDVDFDEKDYQENIDDQRVSEVYKNYGKQETLKKEDGKYLEDEEDIELTDQVIENYF